MESHIFPTHFYFLRYIFLMTAIQTCFCNFFVPFPRKQLFDVFLDCTVLRYHATSVCCSEATNCAYHNASGATVCRKDAAAAMRDDGLRATCSHRVVARRRAPQERPDLGMHSSSSSSSSSTTSSSSSSTRIELVSPFRPQT
jgi:hypothetical protein